MKRQRKYFFWDEFLYLIFIEFIEIIKSFFHNFFIFSRFIQKKLFKVHSSTFKKPPHNNNRQTSYSFFSEFLIKINSIKLYQRKTENSLKSFIFGTPRIIQKYIFGRESSKFKYFNLNVIKNKFLALILYHLLTIWDPKKVNEFTSHWKNKDFFKF